MNQVSFTPTLRQLRAFRAVFQLRKLSAAAEQLSVTQSAISVLIRQMEDGLGARLFDRTTRSLRPTAAAADVIGIVERVLRDVDSLGAGLRDHAELRKGRVALAVTPTLGELLLPPIIGAFSAAHPDIQVVIDDCAPEHFVARIVGEHVDLGLGSPESAAADVDSQPVLSDTLSLVCRSDHRLAARKRLRWADLDRVPVITVRHGYGIRQMVDSAAIQAGVNLDVSSEVTFLSTALWMTEIGLVASLVPAGYAHWARGSDLVVRPLREPTVSRDISIVTKRGRSMSPAASALIDVIRKELAGAKKSP